MRKPRQHFFHFPKPMGQTHMHDQAGGERRWRFLVHHDAQSR
jgi:hypothetical protein